MTNNSNSYIIYLFKEIPDYQVSALLMAICFQGLNEEEQFYLTKEMLEKIDLKTGQIVATSNEKGKVINNYECYIAAVVKSKEAEEAKIRKKSKFKIIFTGGNQSFS